METSYRDNAIAKNQRLLQLTLLWAMSVTVATIILTFVCFYAFTHREIHWLPFCTGSEFSVGEHSYSPSYLKEMGEKVLDLRLTYSPDTIDARYEKLLHLIPAKNQERFKKLLDSERKTVHEKNISSVFYADGLKVDIGTNQASLHGLLYRTSHGIGLTPEPKTYELQFSYQHGLLSLQSIKETDHVKRF